MLELVAEVVLVTASGALSPGPLTLSAVALGMRRGWRAGFLEAAGHAAFEFPLVIALALGAAELSKSGTALGVVGLAGSAALLVFSALLAREALRSGANWQRALEPSGAPILVGLTLTVLNPHFLVWWATVGLKLVVDVMLAGGLCLVALMYPAHVWLDFAWLSLVAHLSSKGRALGPRAQRALALSLSAVMALYAALFALDSASRLLP